MPFLAAIDQTAQDLSSTAAMAQDQRIWDQTMQTLNDEVQIFDQHIETLREGTERMLHLTVETENMISGMNLTFANNETAQRTLAQLQWMEEQGY
jgi:hypothetical protein